MIKMFVLCVVLSASALFASDKIGVILMHGKWSTNASKSPIGKLGNFLEQKGFVVVSKDMPWSRTRKLDKTYEESMLEIHDLVQALKNKGVTKIIVGGHSMGANAALGYAARYEGLSGVLAIAPGHVPEVRGFQNKMDNDWQNAKKMVALGDGEQMTDFKDINQGKQSRKSIKANIYLSWYSPSGAAVMPVNVTNLKSNTPLLWIIGEKDLMNQRGEGYAYSKAPSNEKNAYIVVKGGHGVTPIKGKSEILKWLKSL